MQIKTSALIGMGAIGTVYGSLLYKAFGEGFTVIAAKDRAQKLRASGAVLNGSTFYPQISTPKAPAFSPDLIIICVKNTQLEEAIEDMRPFVGKSTLLLPLLNGITARDALQKAFPDNTVFYGLTIGIDAIRHASGVTNTVDGTIQFGHADNTVLAPEVPAVREYLSSADIHAEAPEDMLRAQWRKWMLNVGCNQVSAVTGAKMGQLVSIETNLRLFHEAMLEVVALAQACGVNLNEEDARRMEDGMRSFPPNGKTSMLQDVEARRLTEVDSFAGTVLRLAKERGVAAPVNHVLYCLIKSIEQMYPAN